MRADYIKVNEISFLSISKCVIKKNVNTHGRATIVGLISDEDEERCLLLGTSEKYIHIVAVGSEGKEECIFSGIIENILISSGFSKVLTLELITGTKLLDLAHRTRTFQDSGMTYKQILKSNEGLNSDVKAGSIFLKSGDIIPEQLIAQFKETDWEFAIRMASHLNTCIIPAFTNDGAKYFLGIREGASEKNVTDLLTFSMCKNLKLYEKLKQRVEKKALKVALSEKDAYGACFESRELYEVGQHVKLPNGKSFYVYAVKSFFNGQELVNTYTLRTANGFAYPRNNNELIIGASLEGNILDVKRDKVKVDLKVDKQYKDTSARWFSYSTVYSSPDGTGWYCMPEIGDEVRLYFPTANEGKAYVISAVHLEVVEGGERTNPDIKKFKNKVGKSITFTPSSLTIDNPALGFIELDDEKGITISSEKDIRFCASSGIEIHALDGDVNITASDTTVLRQGNASLILKNDIIETKGAKVYIQEKE